MFLILFWIDFFNGYPSNMNYMSFKLKEVCLRAHSAMVLNGAALPKNDAAKQCVVKEGSCTEVLKFG